MRNAYITKTLLTLALFAAALTPARAAFLDGNTVRVDYLFPDVGTTDRSTTTVVSSAVEFSNLFGYGLSLDLTDTGLLISFLDNLATGQETFNGIQITDINLAIPTFNAVSVNAATTLANFGSTNITVLDDVIRVNFAGLAPMMGNNVVLDINPKSFNPTAIDLPEPSTLLSVVSALGLAFVVRRRS
jgi:hypothetical protein